MRIPDRYSGNAFEADGTPRAFDDDARRHAEELFRRGYVFDEDAVNAAGMHASAQADPEPIRTERPAVSNAGGGQIPPVGGVPAAQSASDGKEAGDGGGGKKENTGAARATPVSSYGRQRYGGILSGIFDKITSEEILLGAVILMLLLNGADDELLIMLVILIFC